MPINPLKIKRFFEQNYYDTTRCITAHNAAIEMPIHKIIPCSKGFIPTFFITDIDNPAPIKKSVTVSPFFAPETIKLLTG